MIDARMLFSSITRTLRSLGFIAIPRKRQNLYYEGLRSSSPGRYDFKHSAADRSASLINDEDAAKSTEGQSWQSWLTPGSWNCLVVPASSKPDPASLLVPGFSAPQAAHCL